MKMSLQRRLHQLETRKRTPRPTAEPKDLLGVGAREELRLDHAAKVIEPFD